MWPWIFVATLIGTFATPASPDSNGLLRPASRGADSKAVAGSGDEGISCPVGRKRSCTLSLRGSRPSSIPQTCLTGPWVSFLRFEQPEPLADRNGDSYLEPVLSIDFDPARGCGCAVFRLTYDEAPVDFSVHLGDSPTNDGFGGDAGSTPKAAEALILRQSILVYSDSVGTRVDPMLDLVLPPLKGRSISLTVCDQSLSFAVEADASGRGALAGKIDSQTFEHLFDISGAGAGGAGAASAPSADHRIYAAFNRVIHVRDGHPSKDRFGSGVSMVEIYLTP